MQARVLLAERVGGPYAGAAMSDAVHERLDTLGPAELREIASLGAVREFRARTVLLNEGDETDSLYIILEGRVRAYVSDAAGREAVLSIMGPGEYFGELAFDHRPRSASVITLEPCRMIVVPRAEFERSPITSAASP
jgi:CRP/FNR family cyclic AMP-dependent transcriptional regulator